ncbi:MAG: NAD(P)/FAD-dependent oxidoreductase, partial [Candidatus Lokiarchaeota archaeon]|nr:NAD(P)/FAD-dependent oxidoreductase [Candidatus Lokiarchaeota archaeon]
WIFPLGEERFNIGCGTFGEDNLNLNLNQLYLEFINDPNIKKLLPKSNYKEIWKGAYPVPTQGVNDESLYGENILLIGDAAGFVSPISGEGIHAGIVSGNIAAETAISALENDNISNLTLKSYKTHQYIKKIIRNFKMKRSMVDFFFENKGYNFSNMLKLANKDSYIKEKVINMFLYNQPLTKELLLRIKSTNE